MADVAATALIEPPPQALRGRTAFKLWLSGLVLGDRALLLLNGVPVKLRPMDHFASKLFRCEDGICGQWCCNANYLADRIFGVEV